MIQDIRAFCLLACALSLLSVMMRAIAPDRLRRQVEMAVNLFLLLCLLTPLANLSFPEFSREDANQETVSQGVSTEALFEREVSRRLKTVVGEKLEQNGIFPEEIRIDITVADDQVLIDFASITLRAEDGQHSQRARELAGQLLGIEVTVSAGQEVT